MGPRAPRPGWEPKCRGCSATSLVFRTRGSGPTFRTIRSSGELCGWYGYRGSLRDVQRWLVLGAEVVVRRGQLMLRALSPLPALHRGLPLHPDDERDPYVFRVDLSEFGLGTARVVFSREPGVSATAVHLEFAPALMSFDKQPAAKNPRPWATGALGVVAAASTAAAARRLGPYKEAR